MAEHPSAPGAAETTAAGGPPQRPPASSGVRIAHVTTVHRAADPRITKELASVRAAGYDAHLVAPHPCDTWRGGIRITALPRASSRRGRLALGLRAFRAARRLGADLYHIHDPELIPVAFALKKATGARVVYDMHENYRRKGPLLGGALRAMEQWAFRWTDHVVVANPAHVSIPRASGARATVVANYFRPPAGEAPHVPHVPGAPGEKPPLERFRLICTGVLSEQRGLAHVIDLAGRIGAAHPAWRVELAGVCYLAGQRRRAEARIREGGAGHVLRRVGWDRYVPWPALFGRCRAAHVGLALMEPVLNHDEVLPTKFFEYLHAGLPILCSDFPLWRAFVEGHRCGAVVAPGDTEAALHVLERWAGDPDAYAQLSANARAAATCYRWASEGERLLHVYEGLLAGRGKR